MIGVVIYDRSMDPSIDFEDMKTDRSKVRRRSDRGAYDKETIYGILDKDFVCQIGIVANGAPVVLPTIYGREGDVLYFHGAQGSAMLKAMDKGLEISLNVTLTNALVLARSAFHHSLNYESVTLFGTAEALEDDKEKFHALKVISDQVLEGRWEEVRQPNANELKVTRVMKLRIDEGSAKIRSGGVKDEDEDHKLGIWAGIVPIERHFAMAEADTGLEEMELPKSVKRIENERF